MLVTVRERVRRRLAAGATLEAVLAAGPTADFDARWQRGLIPGRRFAEAVYRSLRPHERPRRGGQ